MSSAHMSGIRIGGGSGSGQAAAPGAAGWLALAAAPTFALMALWTVISGGPPDMLCMSMHDASPLNGMVPMYALMSLFHAAPWLRLISRSSKT